MKNNNQKTEELLEKGKQIRLSVSERDEMKSQLLSYASFHGLQEKKKATRPFIPTLWLRSLSSAALALVFVIGTGYASASSLPGELLYPIKTEVLEELTAATKLTPLSQLAYHHERYETRLYELQTLAERGEITQAAITDSQTELTKLSQAVSELMGTGNDIDDQLSLELVGDMLAMGSATEAIVRSGSTAEQRDAFANITDDLEQVHDQEIIDLLATSSSTVEAYIETQLSEISAELSEEDLAEVITVRVADYVEDALLSLESKNYEAVVNLVSDSVILIEAGEYQNDYADEILE